MCAVSSSTLTPSYAARYCGDQRCSACAQKLDRKVGWAWTYNKGEERVFFHLAARFEEDVQFLGRLDTCGRPSQKRCTPSGQHHFAERAPDILPGLTLQLLTVKHLLLELVERLRTRTQTKISAPRSCRTG